MVKQHVFLSYSSKDVAYVDRLEIDLHANDYEVWRDKSALEAGDEWADEIEEALNAAWAVIIIQTPESEKSRWVRNEVEYAEEHNIPVIPILVRGDRWFGMYDKQYIDVRGHENQPPPDALYIALLKYAPPVNLQDELGKELLRGDSARRVNLVVTLENMARNVRSPKAQSAQQMLTWFSQDADTYVRNAAVTALKRLKVSTRQIMAVRSRSRSIPIIAVVVIFAVLILGLGGALAVRLIQGTANGTQAPITLAAQSTIPAATRIDSTPIPSPANIAPPVATSQSTPPSLAMLFERHFDDDSSEGIDIISGNWEIRKLPDGAVAYCANNDDWSNFVFGAADWKNYSMEFRVIFFPPTGADSDKAVIPSVRVQDDSSDYRFEMNPGVGTLMLAHWTSTTYQGLSFVRMPFAYNTWYLVRGEADGDHLRYFLNGHLVAQAKDSTYAQGMAGFEVSPQMNICIDDLIVRQLD